MLVIFVNYPGIEKDQGVDGQNRNEKTGFDRQGETGEDIVFQQ